ncbi:MAG: hypothetical protein FWD57_08345 [Polyangiaceae bacterium]|nr:hypothetical protein [Polyangiaceae bacterium]
MIRYFLAGVGSSIMVYGCSSKVAENNQTDAESVVNQEGGVELVGGSGAGGGASS